MDDTLRSVLVCIGILLIVSGAGLALCFGYVAYEALFQPEKVAVITMLMQKIVSTTDAPVLTANIDGKVATYHIADSLKVYALCMIFIFGFGLLINTARCLSDAGVHIIKVLWPAETAQK